MTFGWSEPQPGASVDDLAAILAERHDPYRRQPLQLSASAQSDAFNVHISRSFRAPFLRRLTQRSQSSVRIQEFGRIGEGPS